MDIKAEVMSAAEKYGLGQTGESYESKIKKTIAEILNRIPKDKKVAVRGAGEHTRELLAIDGCGLKIECIFDYSKTEKTTEEIAGNKYNIYPSGALDGMDIDVVVISSFTHRKRIAEDLKENSGEFEVLDIYEELKKSGLDVNAPFYRNAEDTYENVIYYRKLYHTEKTADSLKNLITAYLKIYDFINFEKYADEYVAHKYPDYGRVQAALDEIKHLLDEVKRKIKAREKRDIIIVWNDQMDYGWLQYAPYMQEESKNSMFFENAYTMTPFTTPTMMEIFQRKKSIDDGIYHKTRSVANSQNSQIIRDLEKTGYKFVYIGNEAYTFFFDKESIIDNYTYNSTCIRCIELLQKLLDEEQPVCIILHALVETHNPYLSGEMDDAKYYEWPLYSGDSEEKVMAQRKKSLEYWDKQLAFYMGFMPKSCIKVFMSDHGARYNSKPLYINPTTHIVFFIVGENVPQKRCKRMFSLYDLYKAVKCIINDEYEEEEIFSDYVLMQETNIFNRAAIRFYIENNAWESSLGFRAVRTKKELYVKLASGRKYYYLLPDEETDCIEEADRERLEWLDKLAGDKFEDVSEYEEELKNFRKQFERHE